MPSFPNNDLPVTDFSRSTLIAPVAADLPSQDDIVLQKPINGMPAAVFEPLLDCSSQNGESMDSLSSNDDDTDRHVDDSVSNSLNSSGHHTSIPELLSHVADVQTSLALTSDLQESSVSTIMQQRIDDRSAPDCEDAFFVADIGELVSQYVRWKKNLPRIEPFYAIKCNTDPVVLKTLAALNTGFDCASRAELAAVLDLGVDPVNIIYANPCKQNNHIRYAASRSINKMTFDNAEELYKIKANCPDAELVIRIITDDSHSVCKFSCKFGAPLHITKSLLQLAKSLDLSVIGVSFHVGSGCRDPIAFREAVIAARNVFDEAKEVGYEFKFLDVGGGFPGNNDAAISFETIAPVLREAVDEFFPADIRVIAEPGRFFVASVFTLAVNVTAKRTIAPATVADQESYMYYINDGIYGSFNCIPFDHANPTPRVLVRDNNFLFGQQSEADDLRACSIWGPTCDSIDCITRTGLLPKLEIGDWMYFENMGAYTVAAASNFNGFAKTSIIYTNTAHVLTAHSPSP
eukprot:Partr_v1_DN28630_c2_g1_i4_m50071 putative ornithine decarboxylase